MPSAARVFSITELRRTGQGVIEPTLVQFRFDAKSHTLPITEIAPTLRVTTSRDEPVGSTEVCEQVLVAAWQPFGIRGIFDDKYAGFGFAQATLLEFRKLVARGSLVRIEFEELSFTGLITNFTFHYIRRTRVDWEFTFSPHTFGDGEVRVGLIVQATSRPTREHVAETERLMASLNARRDAARSIAMARAAHVSIGDQLRAISLNVLGCRLSVDRGLEVDAVRQLRSLAARFRGIRDGAQRVVQTLTKLRSDTQVDFDDAKSTYECDVWIKASTADARRLVVRSYDAEQDANLQAEARPRALYRPHAGESIYSIATKFYGSPAAWRSIYSANRLASLQLTGREELLIPERGSAGPS